MATEQQPAKGQRWIHKRLDKDRREVRIMAVAENYVMARYKGASPLVRDVKSFLQLFELKPEAHQ